MATTHIPAVFASSLRTITQNLRRRLSRWIQAHTPAPSFTFEPLEPRIQLSSPSIENLSNWDVPRVIPVSTVAVRFSEPVDLSTFTWEDLVLLRDNSSNLTNSGITIAASGWDPNVYQISLPAALMSPSGVYDLAVTGATINTQAGGTPYINSLGSTWTIMGKTLNSSQFSAPRTIPVTSIAVRFSEPINLSTFTWEDLYLNVDGGFNIATSAITIAASGWDPNVYQITIPSSLTSAAGDYILAISGFGIRAAANNVQMGLPVYSTWEQLGKVLNMSEFPTPRTTPVQTVSVRLSDAIDLATFTWADITLTRDAGANLSSSLITIALSSYDPKVYVITLPSALTTPAGAYQITVNGTTITTPGGTALSNSNSTTWTMT